MCLFGRKKILQKQKELSDKIDFLTVEITKREREIEALKNELTGTVVNTVTASNTALIGGVKSTMDAVAENVKTVLGENEKRIQEMRVSMDKNLAEIRENNEKRLTEMKQVVEEKLTASLNERLTQAFSSVNESLAKVNQGLGEMKNLTGGVTDLKKMLGNVKTRGVFGEVSLSNILMNILTPDQYKEQFNLAERGADDGRHVVDFVVILPGQNLGDRVFLPIDAKFPLEDYQRLVSASDLGDAEGVAVASKALNNAIKSQAMDIRDKYIRPPKTVDFAIMYLPIEGLYAEVVRNAGLLEELRNKYKVIPAGPTTVTALLNSLQIGFKTLAVQKRSAEVWSLLGSVKKEFETFNNVLVATQTKLDQANKELDKLVGVRSRQISRKLSAVESNSAPLLIDDQIG